MSFKHIFDVVASDIQEDIPPDSPTTSTSTTSESEKIEDTTCKFSYIMQFYSLFVVQHCFSFSNFDVTFFHQLCRCNILRLDFLHAHQNIPFVILFRYLDTFQYFFIIAISNKTTYFCLKCKFLSQNILT